MQLPTLYSIPHFPPNTTQITRSIYRDGSQPLQADKSQLHSAVVPAAAASIHPARPSAAAAEHSLARRSQHRLSHSATSPDAWGRPTPPPRNPAAADPAKTASAAASLLHRVWGWKCPCSLPSAAPALPDLPAATGDELFQTDSSRPSSPLLLPGPERIWTASADYRLLHLLPCSFFQPQTLSPDLRRPQPPLQALPLLSSAAARGDCDCPIPAQPDSLNQGFGSDWESHPSASCCISDGARVGSRADWSRRE